MEAWNYGDNKEIFKLLFSDTRGKDFIQWQHGEVRRVFEKARNSR